MKTLTLSRYPMKRQEAKESLKSIGLRFRQAREAEELTLDQMAALTGIPTATISRFERGSCDTYSVMAAYHDAIYLITGKKISVIDQSGRRWK